MRFIFFVLFTSGAFHAALSNGFVKFFDKWFGEFYEGEHETHLAHSSSSGSSSEYDLCNVFSVLVELDYDDSEESDEASEEINPPVITGPSWLQGTPIPPEVEGPVNFPGSPGEFEQQEKPSPGENDGQRPTFPLPPYYLPQNEQQGPLPSNSVQSIPNVPPPPATIPIVPPPDSNATLPPEDTLILATSGDEVDDTDGPGVIDEGEDLSG